MKSLLSEKGYQQTRRKRAQMEVRLAALRERKDLHSVHRAEAERSYLDMICPYLRDIKLYEAAHSLPTSTRHD